MTDEPIIGFDQPTHIPPAAATRHVWGDAVAGQVADLTFVSTNKITQLIFSLGPGGVIRHSDDFKTIFAADEVYYVLSGMLVLNNPQTGEVHRVQPGEAVFFRRDTWHHGFNYSGDALRVLEFFAPPPAQGTGAAYARQQPDLTDFRYSQDEWLGRWPAGQAEARQAHTIRVVRDADLLWRLEGRTRQTLVGLLASTEHLTVGKVYLLPGKQGEMHAHAGDEALYVLEGNPSLTCPAGGGQRWHELSPGDGFYLPEGVPHQYGNYSSRPACLIFGVAPLYPAPEP